MTSERSDFPKNIFFPNRQMKILITGASGFIGSYMVERALQEGHEVWAAVRATSSRKYLTDERIRFIELDLGHAERLTGQLADHFGQHGAFDGVIHAAGATKCRHAEDFFRINADGTRLLASTLLATGALRKDGRFVFISSLSAFGPVHEQDDQPISETDFPRPDTAYGCSKLAAEAALKEMEGLNYVVLRPTGVYGPRERDYFMMAQSIKRHVDFAVGYKPQYLTFIYVDDLVSAAMLALTRGKSGRAYFVSDGDTYCSRTFSLLLQKELGVKGVAHIVAPLWVLRAVSWVAERLARLSRSTSTLNSDKYRIMRQRNWRCDIQPAREELGYEPQWPLQRGVKAAVAWYKANHWL